MPSRARPSRPTPATRPTSLDAPAVELAASASAATPRLDGRRTHVVDRALDYAALADQGLTVAQIARRRRRSKGYVSILLRLGHVLATLPAGEVAALRSPRITWTIAQRVVRADTPAAEVRAQLRHALGGFSTHNIDRRRRGLRAPRADGGATTRDHAASGASSTGALAGWGFDQVLFASDPAGFVRAHLDRMQAVHDAVLRRAAREIRDAATRRVTAGQSIRRLTAAVQRLPPADQAQIAAVEALTAFDLALTAARTEALARLAR